MDLICILEAPTPYIIGIQEISNIEVLEFASTANLDKGYVKFAKNSLAKESFREFLAKKNTFYLKERLQNVKKDVVQKNITKEAASILTEAIISRFLRGILKVACEENENQWNDNFIHEFRKTAMFQEFSKTEQ